MEVTDFLKVHRSTVHKLAEKGELPAIKVGSEWRFDRLRSSYGPNHDEKSTLIVSANLVGAFPVSIAKQFTLTTPKG